MSDATATWRQRKRPMRLERRVEFADYEATRDFLDAVAELCEQAGLYPDISFGRTYVNLTIHAAEGATELVSEQTELARRIDGLTAKAV